MYHQQLEFVAVSERQESSFASKALVNVSTPASGQDGKQGMMPGFLLQVTSTHTTIQG